MTTALDSFNEYMAAPCHELDERDAGRNDPHSQCFDEWGVPREMLFWLWEAAMRAAAQPSRAEVLEEAAQALAEAQFFEAYEVVYRMMKDKP
jgi:hypothetical protein